MQVFVIVSRPLMTPPSRYLPYRCLRPDRVDTQDINKASESVSSSAACARKNTGATLPWNTVRVGPATGRP
jgi:hypothetical protein